MAIQGSNIYIPTSSSQGSPTLQDVYYQYVTKPSSMGFLLSGILTVLQIAANIIAQNYVGAIFVALDTGIAGDTGKSISNIVQKYTPAFLLNGINNKVGIIGSGISKA